MISLKRMIFSKKNLIILLGFATVFVFFFSRALALSMQAGGKEIKIDSPQYCKLKHKIEAWGSSYDPGTCVGATSTTGLSFCTDVSTTVDWQGICALDGVYTVAETIRWVGLVVVSALMFLSVSLYVTAGGSTERVRRAQKFFVAILIGVLVIVLSEFIPAIARFFIGV